jgi:hypothetical protein
MLTYADVCFVAEDTVSETILQPLDALTFSDTLALYKRQHTSAYVSIRQHTSAYVSIRLQPLDTLTVHILLRYAEEQLRLFFCDTLALC